MSAEADQFQVLQYLVNRISEGDDRYCTIPTIRRNTGLEKSNQYILALTDDLETSGLIITRQAYQMAGGRLFQATARGIDVVRSGKMPLMTDSAGWTGEIQLSESQRLQIRNVLTELKNEISAARLSNSKTANAMALVEAIELLVETPDPLWPEILRLIRSPTLQGITSITGLLLSLFTIIFAAG